MRANCHWENSKVFCISLLNPHPSLINFDMKYIDAERLKCELEKRLKNVRDYMNGAGMKYKGPKYYKAQGKESAYDALLSVIDSLQQEQPEVFDTVAFQKGVQEGRRLEKEEE